MSAHQFQKGTGRDKKEVRKEMFYFMMHSKYFILQLYGVRHGKDQSDSERENPADATKWATHSD